MSIGHEEMRRGRAKEMTLEGVLGLVLVQMESVQETRSSRVEEEEGNQ